jgi:ABC-type transporter Mla subunit MlaD
MPRFNKNEIRVGLFVIIPFVALLLVIFIKLGYSISGSTIDVFMKVDSISSIKEGTPVKIKGYVIGRVHSVEPVYKPALHFLARLRLNSDIDLYEDCSAIIMNQNVIGDPVVELRNPERKNAPLLPNDVIEGIEYVNLESLLQDVHVLMTTISSTADVIKQITTDSRQNLKSLVGNLSGTVETLNSILSNSSKDVIETISALRKTVQTLDEISTELKKHPAKFLFSGKD